jgi:hypothetical protein
MTVPALKLTRILIITDAWLPQVNGVVRSIEALVREAPALGVDIEILAADGFRTVPLPTYPQVRAAITRPGAVRRRIEELNPDFIHIATEGPLGISSGLMTRKKSGANRIAVGGTDAARPRDPGPVVQNCGVRDPKLTGRAGSPSGLPHIGPRPRPPVLASGPFRARAGAALARFRRGTLSHRAFWFASPLARA